MEFFPTKDENNFNESSKHRKEMKKNILKATLVAAFTLLAGYNVYSSQKAEGMSDLALANVEALADAREKYIEGGTCWGTGTDWTNVTCYGGYTICCWAHMDVYGKN